MHCCVSLQNLSRTWHCVALTEKSNKHSIKQSINLKGKRKEESTDWRPRGCGLLMRVFRSVYSRGQRGATSLEHGVDTTAGLLTASQIGAGKTGQQDTRVRMRAVEKWSRNPGPSSSSSVRLLFSLFVYGTSLRCVRPGSELYLSFSSLVTRLVMRPHSRPTRKRTHTASTITNRM